MPRSSPMLYSELHPAPELAPWVAAHWYFRVVPETPESDHWVPLTGGAILTIAQGLGSVLVGPRTEPLQTRVRGGDVFWGTHFWPGTAPSLFGFEAENLRSERRFLGPFFESAGLLDDGATQETSVAVAGLPTEAEAATQLDRLLLPLIPRSNPLDDRVMQAVFLIIAAQGNIRIKEVADAVGLSPRHLRRRFRQVVGLSPKELTRIERFHASAVEAVAPRSTARERSPWVSIAADRGYADQAHLIREFRRLLGVTPRGFDDHFDRIDHRRMIR